MSATPDDRATLRSLRRLRRDRRLGSIEWFDVAYRVYLFALGGTALVIWASDLLDGLIDEVSRDDLLAVGPGAAGVAVAAAMAIGLRHGSEGGPVAIEPGDVRHVLLSPLKRRTVLLQPVAQRMRSVAFMLAATLAIIGQLIGRDVVGSRAAWAGAGLLFGSLVGVAYVASAVLAHGVRMRGLIAGLLGAAAVGWQLTTAVATGLAYDADEPVSTAAQAGPFDLVGSIALWGVRQRPIDVIGLAAIAGLGVLALAAAGRLRIEPLERRGDLVAQLRFAATVQDIRTVVLLRRQLSADSMRARPWFGGAEHPGSAQGSTASPTRPRPRRVADAEASIPAGLLVRRGFASFGRFSGARLLRIVLLAVVAGVSVHAALEWTPIAYVATAVTVFLVGLELVEPLGQEIDHPDRTDSLPVERAHLYSLLLIAPAIVAVPVAIVGGIVVAALDPDRVAAALVLAVPVLFAGSIGSVATTVRDAAQPPAVRDTNITGADRTAESPFALPEFAGVSTVFNAVVPIALSALAVAPIAAMDASPTAGTAVRAWVGVALCVAVLVIWVRRRDRWALRVREFFAAGRAQMEAGR